MAGIMTKLVAAPLRSVNSQPTLSRQELNHYFARIQTLCQQVNICATQKVETTTKGIWAEKGETLQKDHFAPETLDVLPADFDKSIYIEGQLTAETLLGHFKLMIEADEHLKAYAEKHHSMVTLTPLCSELNAYPSLLTKLTCLSYSFPHAFKNALFTAWLGLSTAKAQAELLPAHKTIFLSAILQGLGLLFLPSNIQLDSKALTAEQRLALQKYPVLGQKLLLNQEGLDPNIARTVFEHREHLDGSGYPQGKLGTNICPNAQLLNVLSSLYAAYTYRLKPAKRPLSCLIAIIKMNGHTRFGRTGLQLIQLLQDQQAEYEATLPTEVIPAFISLVKHTFNHLKECVTIAEAISIDIGFRHNQPKLHAIQNRIIHIDIAVTQSEVINEAYLRWLGHIEKNKITHAYGEVEDTFLRMHEVAFHIEKLKHALAVYMEDHQGQQDTTDALKRGLEKLNQVIPPAIPPVLLSTWVATIAQDRHESY